MARHGLGNHFLHRRNSSRSTPHPEETGCSYADSLAALTVAARELGEAADELIEAARVAGRYGD